MSMAMFARQYMANPLRRALRGDFVRDGAIVFISAMAVNVVNYAIHFILSRKLGVGEYGSFASLMSSMAILSIPASIMTMVVVKFVAEFNAAGDFAKIRVLSQRVLGIAFSLAAACIGVALAAHGAIANYLHLQNSANVIAAAFTLSFALVLPIVRGVLQGTQDFIALAFSTSSEAVAKIVLAVFFASVGFGVPGVFAGYAIAGGLNLVYTLVAVRKHWDARETRLAVDTRRLIQTMGGVIVGTSAITIIGFVDLPLVKHFFSATDAGIYGAVSVCGKMLLFVAGFVPTLVLPKAAHRAADGRAPGTVLIQGLFMTLLFACAGLAVFSLIPGFIVKLTYGAAFLPAARYIFLYGVAMSLLAATNVIVSYKIGLHNYNFVLPVIAIAILEPVGIHLFHASIAQVIEVLVVGNAIGFVLCLARTPFRAAVQEPDLEAVVVPEIAL